MYDEDQPIAPVVPGLDDPPENLWEQLGQKRKAVADSKDVMLPVPGYDHGTPFLGVKYRLLDGPEIDKIGARIRTEFSNRWDRTLYAATDTMIAACEGLYYHTGDREWKPLTIAKEPVRGFTAQLAEAMQFADDIGPGVNNPRAVLMALFANNDVAISQHFFLLNRWMTDTSVDVSREMQEGNL